MAAGLLIVWLSPRLRGAEGDRVLHRLAYDRAAVGVLLVYWFICAAAILALALAETP